MNQRDFLLVALLSAHLGACGSDDVDGATSPDAPRILEFTTDVAAVTHTGDPGADPAIRFSLIATDPNGVSDIIGASLKSADESVTFTTLATSGEEGAYSTQLTWSTISAAIEIDGPEVATMTFVAVVFDVAGHQTKASVTVDFSCDMRDVCGGACVSTKGSDEHCGACNNACGDFEACLSSVCKLNNGCDPLDFFADEEPCNSSQTCTLFQQGFGCVGITSATPAVGEPCTNSCKQGSICGAGFPAPYTISVCQAYCHSSADCQVGEDCMNLFTVFGWDIPGGGDDVKICVP